MNVETATFDVVRMYDAEVVRHLSGEVLGNYSVQRDLDALDLPDDAAPIRFRCRRLSRKSRRQISDLRTPEAKYERAFCLGVLSIENLPDSSGKPRTWTASRGKTWDSLTDDALDATGLGDADLWEIGSVIATLSFLPLGGEVNCPQLDSSIRAYAAMGMGREHG